MTDAEGATHTACVNNSEYPQWMADWDADPSNAAGGLEFLFDSEGECCAHPDHECDGYEPVSTGEPSGGPTGSPTEGTADDGEVMWWHGEFINLRRREGSRGLYDLSSHAQFSHEQPTRPPL